MTRIQGPQSVLVQRESFLQRMSSHGFVEHVAAGEVENAAVILIFRQDPYIKSTEGMVAVKLTDAHELSVAVREHIGNQTYLL